jgi:sec-independent protein translocase protein TatB
MFGVDSMELLVVALVALVVIGPKELPRVLRVAGHWIGKARNVASQFRTGFDDMVREAELAELEKKWQEENAKIMRDNPPPVIEAEPEPIAVDDMPSFKMDEVQPEPTAEPDSPKPKKTRTKKAPKEPKN